MSYHKLIFVGNVGVSPKLYQGTTEYVRFSVASNRIVHNLDGTQEEVTIWFNVSSGKGLQALLNNVTKGCKVLVEGQLVADKVSGHPKIFTNRAGEADAAYEVAASTIQVLARPAQQKEKPFVSNLMRTDYPDDYDKDDYDKDDYDGMD